MYDFASPAILCQQNLVPIFGMLSFCLDEMLMLWFQDGPPIPHEHHVL